MHTSLADRPATAVAAGVALTCSVTLLLWWCGEASRGLLYIPLYLIALVPGFPLGFALFGRRHAAGWIAGALLGYGLTALACSVAIHLGARTGPGFLLAWVLLSVVTWLLARPLSAPLVTLPAWSRRDTAGLLLVLLLVPALMGLPYKHNGLQDDHGTRYYRAYFTADFLWHMALTGELTRLSLPPSNPYLADRTLHYYWMYFTVPAVGASVLGTHGDIVEQCLEINAVLTGLLFVAAIFVATWGAVPRVLPTATAVALSLVAASAQGWYGIYDLISRGRSLEGLRELNIGALTSWIYQGLRIDGLPRSLWWTPQHAAACALGLISMVAATTGAGATSLAAIALIGVSLGTSLAFSPLIGGTFALVYGISVIIAAGRVRTKFATILFRHALAIVPVVAALAWCAANQMFEGAAGALAIGFGGLARHASVETLVLALGPLLLAAAAGLVLPRFPASAIPQIVGVTLGFALLYFVRLLPDPAWVGFRAGQILQITLPGLAAVFVARTLDASRPLKAAGIGVLALLFAAGLPTTLIDTYNAQDIRNRAMGPGFRWTIDITAAEQAAFDWIRNATPATAVVQMEPTVRGRDTWTLVPSFAERRMAAGLPISLIDDPEYHRRSELVKTLYDTTDAALGWEIARQLRIDFIYADRTERKHYGAGLIKFEDAPQFFAPAYRNDEAVVYIVRR